MFFFQKSLHSCALDESSCSIGRAKKLIDKKRKYILKTHKLNTLMYCSLPFLGGTHEFGVGAEQAPAHMEHWRHAAAAAAMAATPSGPSSRSSSSCSSSSPSEHGDSRDAALDGQKVYLPFKGKKGKRYRFLYQIGALDTQTCI